MAKFLLTFLFAFLILSSSSFANRDDDMEARLQKEYGYDLTRAPFFLRFAFYKEFNIEWKKSNYDQREVFLTDYVINSAAEQARERAEAKIEAQKEKALLADKKEELYKEKEKLKARLAREKAIVKANKERQKEFDSTIIEQEKELQEMERETSQGGQGI